MPDYQYLDPRNFPEWTYINLGHCIDLIMNTLIPIEGKSDILMKLAEALEMNREYAKQYRQHIGFEE